MLKKIIFLEIGKTFLCLLSVPSKIDWVFKFQIIRIIILRKQSKTEI